MERSRSPCRKYLEARQGGSNWTTSLDRECACRSRTATNQWTALGVLDIPEQLATSPAGDVAPVQRGLRVWGRHAPPLPRRAHRGAVAPCQHRQPPVGERQSSASLDVEIDREAQPLEPHEDAR